MKRKISVGTSILLVITAVLLTFSLTLTFAWTTGLTDATSPDEPFAPTPDGAFYNEEKLQHIINLFTTNSVNGIPMDDATDALLKGFVAYCGDAYASYMTKEEYAAFVDSYQGSFVGIGVTVQMDEDKGMIRVIDVIPDSPADKAGFRFGDYITAVDGKTVDYAALQNNALDAIGSMIRGEAGTEVSVTVERDGDVVTMTAIRAKVVARSVRSQIGEYAGKTVAYIQVSSFDYPTALQFKEAIDEAEAAGVDYIIYDLRNNGGGLLEAVNAMLTYILPSGSLITEVESKLTTTKHYAGDRITESLDATLPEVSVLANGRVVYNKAYADHTVTVPSAVLINGYSASAAELFTSALRDHEAATVVGENSYGKGCMQVTYNFSDGTALKLTTAFYNPPCGVNYDKTTEGPVGIAPAIEVIFTSEENKNNLYLMPHEKDRQFVAAFNALTDGEKLHVPDPEHVKV